MRPEDKSADDNQMGPRNIGDTGDDVGTTAGVGLTPEDKSGLPVNGGVPNTPADKGYTAPMNAQQVPINKSRGTGIQVNNGALSAAGGNPAGAGPAADDDGSGPGKTPGKGLMGYGSVASEMAKVTSVTGDKVSGMNYGPSIGRFDNPPAVITSTGTPQSIDTAIKVLPDRWPGIDTEHRHPHPKDNDGTPTGLDRIWR